MRGAFWARHLISFVLLLSIPAHADPCEYQPSSIIINGTRITVNDKPFFAQGIGYSPVPPDTDLSEYPNGDYFTSRYSELWDRDLELMRDMNATLIRVWSWNFMNDHSAFLNMLINNERPIYILIPFMMSLEIYPDLTNTTIRKQALTDFRAFLQYNNHPAVFGYMIGNELDLVYGQSLDALFSLTNAMYRIKTNMNVQVPMTVPLSSSSFNTILTKYYTSLQVDFWSIQVYSVEDMEDIFFYYQDLFPSTRKPLLVTEFGADALNFDNHTVNETKQAEMLTDMWNLILAFASGPDSIVIGASVMEWCDEWWKGDVPDVLHPGCPSFDVTAQTFCGNRISNTTFVYEEWLGITEQQDPYFAISYSEYCIKPRQAYFALRDVWCVGENCSTDPTEDVRCGNVNMKNPLYYMGIPILFLVILWIGIECFHRKSAREERASMKVYLPQQIQAQMQQQQQLERVLKEVSQFSETRTASSHDLTRQSWKIGKSDQIISHELRDITKKAYQLLQTIQKHQQVVTAAQDQMKKLAQNLYSAALLPTLDQLAQLQDIQRSRLEKLQVEVAKQSQPGFVENVDEIFDNPRPQLSNLESQQEWLTEPIPIIEECRILFARTPLPHDELRKKLAELQDKLRAMEKHELTQLDFNITRLQRTLNRQNEAVPKQDTLTDLKFISIDLQRQELDLKNYRERIREYVERSPPEKRGKLLMELRTTPLQLRPSRRKPLKHVKETLHILVHLMFRKYTYSLPFKVVEQIDTNLKDYKDELSSTTALKTFDGPAILRMRHLYESTERADPEAWHFEVAAMRVENLIWDKILSSEVAVSDRQESSAALDHNTDVQLLTMNTACVYYRYMEGYSMWRKRAAKILAKEVDDITPESWVDKLEDLVLWNVVSQCASTINHAPEKVCEVFHYTKLHVQDNGVSTSFVDKLLGLFGVYYKEIGEHRVNFDDVNADAVEPKEESPKEIALQETSKLLSHHDDDRVPFDFFSQKKCYKCNTYHKEANESGDCRYTKVAFPQNGGIFGAFVCYGWLVRINLWILTIAWYFLQHVRPWDCANSILQYLALVDSSISFFVAVFQFYVVGTILARHILLLIFSLIWMLLMWAYFEMGGIFHQLLFQYQITLYAQFMFYIDLPFLYLVYAGLVMLGSELHLLFLKAPFPVKGRENKEMLEQWVWVGFGFAAPVIFGSLLAVQLLVSKHSLFGEIVSYDVQLITLIMGIPISGTSLLAFLLALGGGAAFGRLLALRKLSNFSLTQTENIKRREKIMEEIRYMAGNIVFWLSVLVLYWVLCFQLLLPSIDGISWSTCHCDPDDPEVDYLAQFEKEQCSMHVKLICYAGVVLTWAGVFLISFVGANACFQIVLLGAGAFLATANRIGNVSSWGGVGKHFKGIETRCFPMVSDCLRNEENKSTFWNHFIDSMYKEHLLTAQEGKNLYYQHNKSPDFNAPPRNKEARRRIIKYFWSLEAMLAKESDISVPEKYRKTFQVRTMPSWTIIVPCATETTIFGQAELLRPKSATPRISWIEYLAATYPDEWENFARSGLRTGDTAGKLLLEHFLNTPVYENGTVKTDGSSSSSNDKEPPCSYEEVERICLWASCRGQTLVRTIRGLLNYREGLIKLAELEEGIEHADEDTKEHIKREVAELVARKFQIIIALQIYSPDKFTDDWTVARNTAFIRMLKALSFLGTNNGFDLVYNCSDDKHSGMIRIPNGPFDPATAFSKKFIIERPGKLVIGEPKAENQSHAMAFALNEVLQVNDMNMYNTLENAFKIPFLLNAFFGVPDEFQSPQSVIPPYRIVGFPEHCYTQNLSMVGMLMASAEFCFVTITQRVLASLRVRAHYGHPDFVDGYWARTRGGVSKASHLVNTNEDIFAGYEIFGRGERIAYVEFVEEEKGRESGFNEAFTFEAKLAQGAAQQIRSREIYHLNNRLPLFMRLSLFFGTIGFYLTSMFMSISIDFYMYAIIFFAISGVTYHQLGLMHAVIAVPWMFQIGFVQALPLLVEQMIQQGFWEGFLLFITQIPFGLVFFVFHLRTKAYFFEQGLFVGKGGYKGTGRGFGLDRMSMVEIYKCYFDSHFHNATVLLACMVMYWFVSSETSFSYFLRIASILLVVFSWLMAPVIFNPYATADALHTDLKLMNDWNTSSFTYTSLNDPRLHIANIEAKDSKRKDEIKKWIDARGSWQAWFVKSITDEWEEEDKVFQHPLNFVKSMLQKTVLLAWRYLPWFILGQYYFRLQSIFYFISLVFSLIFVSTIDSRYTNQHEHFALWKASVLITAPSMIVYYVYGNISFGELFLSIALLLMVCFAVNDWALGCYNLKLKIQAKQENGARDLLIKRFRLPRLFVRLQRMWPFVSLIMLGSVNLITVVFCGGLTTLLFNGRVADMWNRAYLYQKQL